MGNFFLHTIRGEANERFKRPCSFSLLHSWSAWAQSYDWIEHTGKFKKGDTLAFVERFGWSPYPSLVVATVAIVSDRDCQLAVISHEDGSGPDAGDIIARSISELLGVPLKRWPRAPLPPDDGLPRLPYFNSRGGGSGGHGL